MIVSESWLREWVSVDLTVQQIADCLTSAGLEVDAVQSLVGKLEHVVVGRVLSVEKHPDADRLNVTVVDVLDKQLKIVCGARNVRQDMLVAVAKVGAKMPNGMKIKQAKMRGVESNGMLCSAAELGLTEESSGLIELDVDAQIGQAVDEYLQLDDHLIDIDLTPNRGDCLSVQGVARELNALVGGQYHPLAIDAVEAHIADSIDVLVQQPEACPKYITRVIKGIDSKSQTPLWMQEKLRRSGIKSIHPVVDITNFVMLELGQPMHAFDLHKVDKRIEVRMAIKGESITLLDDSDAKLKENTLVISDANKPLAIAGVMGGLHSAIDDNSTEIVLESAHFTRKAVSGIARQYGLHTDSSHRFERGVDPQLPDIAIERATQLLIDICGGQAANSQIIASVHGDKSKSNTVNIGLNKLNESLGLELGETEVGKILGRIAEKVEYESGVWAVSPPSYRFDLEREADLVEEVARVKSYDVIPTAIPNIAPTFDGLSDSDFSIRQLKQTLVARDYHEAINYSFIHSEYQKHFSNEKPIKLLNPLAENMNEMRTSLIPGLLSSLLFNYNRQHERVRLFEVGASYHHVSFDNIGSTKQKFVEKQRVAGVICGSRHPLQWVTINDDKVDYYDIKADVESVLNLTKDKHSIIFNEFEHIAMHPGQVSSVSISNNWRSGKIEGDDASRAEIGWLGQVHPQLLKQLGLDVSVFAFEIDLDCLMQTQLPKFNGIKRFPSVKRDISILVPEQVPSNVLIHSIKHCLQDVLDGVTIFDVYQGESVAVGKKSLSLRLNLQASHQTMTDEEAEKAIVTLLSVLEKEFDARLRS